MLESLRSMPNMYVFRPCDGNEVAGCYTMALKLKVTGCARCTCHL
jgi:transketolase